MCVCNLLLLFNIGDWTQGHFTMELYPRSLYFLREGLTNLLRLTSNLQYSRGLVYSVAGITQDNVFVFKKKKKKKNLSHSIVFIQELHNLGRNKVFLTSVFSERLILDYRNTGQHSNTIFRSHFKQWNYEQKWTEFWKPCTV